MNLQLVQKQKQKQQSLLSVGIEQWCCCCRDRDDVGGWNIDMGGKCGILNGVDGHGGLGGGLSSFFG